MLLFFLEERNETQLSLDFPGLGLDPDNLLIFRDWPQFLVKFGDDTGSCPPAPGNALDAWECNVLSLGVASPHSPLGSTIPPLANSEYKKVSRLSGKRTAPKPKSFGLVDRRLIRRMSETPTTTTSQKSIAKHLQFVFLSACICIAVLSVPLSSEEKEILSVVLSFVSQDTSHFNTSRIYIVVLFGRVLVVGVAGMFCQLSSTKTAKRLGLLDILLGIHGKMRQVLLTKPRVGEFPNLASRKRCKSENAKTLRLVFLRCSLRSSGDFSAESAANLAI